MTSSSEEPLVAPEFVVPDPPVTERFRLEPLGPEHNVADHAAWTSSMEHIRATPGFAGRAWPPAEGMSLEGNLADLRAHARDFERRTGFTYTVLAVPGGEVVGCVYIYPSRAEPGAVQVRSWVTAARAALDAELYRTVSGWLARAWPFGRVLYDPR
ncbi:N-acetyltransferase [Streptomyces sp. NPDC005435]|uniref:GNAT family N-acetyltransferase n=1 Tax=Streptomyces sp. NPDC005435 TaxID=3154464 RepID=UPI0034568A4E